MTLLTPTDVHTLLGRGTTMLVTDIATGLTVVRQWFLQRQNIWPSVELDVAAWYECEPEAVGLVEMGESEYITIGGCPVAAYGHVS